MIVLQILLVVASFTAHIYAATKENSAPIIGIAAQELKPSLKELHPTHSSFIPASYVKAVESSGARVVPILPNKNESYYRHLMESVNGVVLPGGSSANGPGNPYYDLVTIIYKEATEMNAKNVVFPILGVCLGYEFLITIANSHRNFLMKCNVSFENLPLNFTTPYTKTSRLFADADKNVRHILESSDVTVNHHTWCALENDFNNSSLEIDWFITSLSTSVKNGIEFIASVEHNTHPFFGIQFHPEKNAFEWDPVKNFPHSREAVIAARLFYDTVVKFSAQNNHKFVSKTEEKESLIYNFPAVVDGTGTYQQIYLF